MTDGPTATERIKRLKTQQTAMVMDQIHGLYADKEDMRLPPPGLKKALNDYRGVIMEECSDVCWVNGDSPPAGVDKETWEKCCDHLTKQIRAVKDA